MVVIPDRNGLNFSWLMKLRWSSIAGQTATILGVSWLLGIDVPLLPLFAVVGIELVSNVLCGAWFRRAPRVHEWHLAAVMGLDIMLLTAMLYFTGGPNNPFSFLYLVNIALAAVALHRQWTWMLVGLALLSFGVLPLLDYRPLPLEGLRPVEVVALHQRGKWVAIGVASAFIVHFLRRVTSALGQRENELNLTRQEAAQKERLASLATMAAGAAHELATPLGTIALAAKELERQMEREAGAAKAGVLALEDVRLIRAQVARCRLILDQMGSGVGKSDEQSVESITLGALFDEVLSGVRGAPGDRARLGGGAGEAASAGDGAGAAQPGHERAGRVAAAAAGGGERRHPGDRARGGGARSRAGDGAGAARAGGGAVLHDEGARARDGARAVPDARGDRAAGRDAVDRFDAAARHARARYSPGARRRERVTCRSPPS